MKILDSVSKVLFPKYFNPVFDTAHPTIPNSLKDETRKAK